MSFRFKAYQYCGFCGTKIEDLKFPYNCISCKEISYINPYPVAVILPIIGNAVLIGKRNIQPEKGKWALPGGFIEFKEDWRDAAARELREEIGIHILSKDIKILDAKISHNDNLLIFGTVKTTFLCLEDIGFKPNEETQEIMLVDKPINLAFDSHTEMLARVLRNI